MNAEILFDELEKCFPVDLAMSFDHPGLSAGRRGGEIKTVYLAVDATFEVIKKANEKNADLILTHHPMGLSGMYHVNDKDFIGERVVYIIENKMRHYVLHTNYDALKMGRLVGGILELDNMEILMPTDIDVNIGIGITGDKEEKSLGDWGKHVKEKFSLPMVKVYGNINKKISKVAVVPGSGRSCISEALSKSCDLLITGDIGHHDGIDAVEKGICVIDAGHYGLEKAFVFDMKEWIYKRYPKLKIYTSEDQSPFKVI